MSRLERPKPRAQAVADELRRLVKKRRLVPGDRLPSEAELVEMLGVSRSSVREGIQLLESLGIVDVEQGKGTFLASALGGGLRRVIDWAYGNDDNVSLIQDLSEARLIVEPAQVRLAAQRATDAEIEELVDRYGSDAHLAASDPQAAGLDYHHYIARIAHNDVLLIASNAIRELYSSLVQDLPRPVDEISRLLGWHTKITDGIVRRDPDGAADAMREHLKENRRAVDHWLAESAEGGRRRRPASRRS